MKLQKLLLIVADIITESEHKLDNTVERVKAAPKKTSKASHFCCTTFSTFFFRFLYTRSTSIFVQVTFPQSTHYRFYSSVKRVFFFGLPALTIRWGGCISTTVDVRSLMQPMETVERRTRNTKSFCQTRPRQHCFTCAIQSDHGLTRSINPIQSASSSVLNDSSANFR